MKALPRGSDDEDAVDDALHSEDLMMNVQSYITSGWVI